MPFTVTMPKLSPTMEEGTIVKWHKKVGEFVDADALLFEVATDKATVEYNALDSGWLRQILVADGKEARVNQPVAIFTEEQNEDVQGYQAEGIASTSSQTTAASSGKASSSDKKPAFAPEPPLQPSPSAPHQERKRIKASPLARKLAQQRGLDLSSIEGSGPGQRIISRDLDKAKPSIERKGARVLPKEAAGAYVEEPLLPMRKVISQRLQEAKSSIPHFYVSLKIDAQPLLDLREQLKEHEIKFTYNDLIVRACALALRKHPNVNSGFNSATNSLIRFKTIDISIAVSVQGGLITPIVRHADFKSVQEISEEIRSLAKRAKEGKLDAQEYKGGSFTISNLGMYGVSDFIAIINPPQAAILAVSGILPVPVIKDGQVVPGNEMTLTLSGDHRVIDGVAAAEFLQSLKKLLEGPAILLT